MFSFFNIKRNDFNIFCINLTSGFKTTLFKSSSCAYHQKKNSIRGQAGKTSSATYDFTKPDTREYSKLIALEPTSKDYGGRVFLDSCQSYY